MGGGVGKAVQGVRGRDFTLDDIGVGFFGLCLGLELELTACLLGVGKVVAWRAYVVHVECCTETPASCVGVCAVRK